MGKKLKEYQIRAKATINFVMLVDAKSKAEAREIGYENMFKMWEQAECKANLRHFDLDNTTVEFIEPK